MTRVIVLEILLDVPAFWDWTLALRPSFMQMRE